MFIKGNRRWAASSEGGGGGLLKKRGGVLKNPVEVFKEFDPIKPTLSASLKEKGKVRCHNPWAFFSRFGSEIP